MIRDSENKKEILKRKYIACLKIQKAFRKYRYDPQYKFCKLIQTKNLFLIGIINNIEFNNYIKKENIIIY